MKSAKLVRRTVRFSLISRLLCLSAASLLAFVAIGCGTTRVTGRVVTEQKKPIKAASVETDPPTDYLVTNRFGMFSIERFLDERNMAQPLKEGSYKVTIRKLGYRDKVIPVQVKANDESVLGDIVLKRKRIEMEAMEDVEGTKATGPGVGDLPPPVIGE